MFAAMSTPSLMRMCTFFVVVAVGADAGAGAASAAAGSATTAASAVSRRRARGMEELLRVRRRLSVSPYDPALLLAARLRLQLVGEGPRGPPPEQRRHQRLGDHG